MIKYQKGIYFPIIILLFYFFISNCFAEENIAYKIAEGEFSLNLPDNKFVFMEIKEVNRTTASVSFPLIKIDSRAICHYDLSERMLSMGDRFNSRLNKKTRVFVAHPVSWFNTPYGRYYYHRVDGIPHQIYLPIDQLDIPNEKWFNHTITIVDIAIDGTVEMIHKWIKRGRSQDKTVHLKPGESYAFSDKKYIRYTKVPIYPNENEQIIKDIFKTEIVIANFGIWDKEENVRVGYWDIKQRRHIGFKWDPKKGEYLREKE